MRYYGISEVDTALACAQVSAAIPSNRVIGLNACMHVQ